MLGFLLKKLSGKSEDLSFWEHAEVLRRYLLRSFVMVFILAVAAFFFKDFLFGELILGPSKSSFITYKALCMLGGYLNLPSLCLDEVPLKLINIDLTGQFRWHLVISLIAGFIIAFPFVIWQFWLFVKPALYDTEKRNSRGVILYISMLFIIGVLFGYYIITPLTLNFLAHYELSSVIKNQITISSYISMVSLLPLSTGLVFELPVLVWFIAKAGLISSAFLKRNRKYAIIIILIAAGIITPSTDVFSQLLVSLPLYILYEISIVICRRVYRENKFAG